MILAERLRKSIVVCMVEAFQSFSPLTCVAHPCRHVAAESRLKFRPVMHTAVLKSYDMRVATVVVGGIQTNATKRQYVVWRLGWGNSNSFTNRRCSRYWAVSSFTEEVIISGATIKREMADNASWTLY